MTDQQKNNLKIYYAHLFAYYQRQASDVVIKMYADDLNDLPFDLIMKALETYRQDQKNRMPPLPAQIRGIINPVIEHQDVGILAAAKIVQSVGKFGYTNPVDAQNFIGPLGWQVVRVFGGWDYVCRNLGVTLDLTTFQAQAREISRAESKVVAAGANHLSLGYDPDEPIQIENNKKMGELLALFKSKDF